MFDVFIAEDEPWIRSAIVEMVENAEGNYRVLGEAGNGEEAYMQMTETWPHILITDIMMPNRDGLWLLQTIDNHKLPIASIILSGHDQFEYAREAMHFGALEYLLKPLSEKQLHMALKRAADHYHSFKEIHEHCIKIQHFMDACLMLESAELVKEMQKILNGLMRLKGAYTPHRCGLLKLYARKWMDLFHADENSNVLPQFDPLDDSSVREHFQALAERWLQQSASTNQSVKAEIQKACEYIHNNYMHNITLNKMAAMTHLSPSYFRFLIKQHTGVSLINYLNNTRIANAKKLLLEPDIKVYDVAEMTGFSSIPYFNRTFKSLSGKTPNEYRKSLGLK
ncbi:response regulator transcription factor [Paenibacillus koleovorans]|uniref:response regulator transcription factor n=1 Tax=Paenibacillus koleovorans TaxID=121608 RepID=UPI0013E33F61|nr:response regulator [Paenibacillus koleovorans]